MKEWVDAALEFDLRSLFLVAGVSPFGVALSCPLLSPSRPPSLSRLSLSLCPAPFPLALLSLFLSLFLSHSSLIPVSYTHLTLPTICSV
eukprot:1372555-Rhodomonas_salina.1